MLIKDLEKLRKRTLRERIYEEIVHLILSGELPSGGWVDEKQVIHKLRVSRTPFREAIGILAKVGWSRSDLIVAFMCAAETGTYTSYPLENPITNIG
jgi:Bacterial regulatory proteins, gntR family